MNWPNVVHRRVEKIGSNFHISDQLFVYHVSRKVESPWGQKCYNENQWEVFIFLVYIFCVILSPKQYQRILKMPSFSKASFLLYTILLKNLIPFNCSTKKAHT